MTRQNVIGCVVVVAALAVGAYWNPNDRLQPKPEEVAERTPPEEPIHSDPELPELGDHLHLSQAGPSPLKAASQVSENENPDSKNSKCSSSPASKPAH